MLRLRFDPPRSPALREYEPLLMVLGAALVVYVITLHNGHVWGDDFAQYILHANNLWRGAPYAETGYLPNPLDTEALLVGPKAYPPLAPALFAPVYAAFGLDYRLLKFVQALELCVALGAVWMLLRQYGPTWMTTTVVALVAFHPWTLGVKDMIGSDIPFLGFCYATLALTEYVTRRRPQSLVLWVLIGVLTYLACATRTVGIVLIPIPLVLARLRSGRFTALSVLPLVVLGVLVVLQRLWVPPDSSYVRMLDDFDPRTIPENLFDYARESTGLFGNGVNRPLAILAYFAAVPFILRGLWERVREIRALELFLAAYALIVIVWPANAGYRFLLPFLPAVILYFCEGVRLLLKDRHPRLAYAAIGVLALSEAGNITADLERPAPVEATRPDFLAMTRFARRVSSSNDVFLFRKPRLFALLTGRKATVFNQSGTDADHWALIDSLGVRYLGIGTVSHEDFIADTMLVRPFVERHRNAFDLVFSQGGFKLYRIRTDHAVRQVDAPHLATRPVPPVRLTQ